MTIEISVFFNHQFFTDRLISDLDFWLVDKHDFLKKFSFWEMGDFGPKNCVSGSAGRIFLKF